MEPTIIVAKCDCRYMVMSRLDESKMTMVPTLTLDAICTAHSYERTRMLKLRSIPEKHSTVRTTDRGNHE